MLISGGRLVLSDSNPAVVRTTYHPATALPLSGMLASYGTIYKRQTWVYTVVRKRALATRRLPLKVYQRTEGGRQEARDTPLARLLRNPNPRHSGPFLWEWTSSTFDTCGEAIWLKVRGRDGRPGELWPVHPSNIAIRVEDNGELSYVYGVGVLSGADPQYVIPERDVVHFKAYNPDSTTRGLSPLEALRQTLLNEDAARRASAAFWSNGARPSGYLSHPGKLSQTALDRLATQWNDIHGSVDNFGKWAILEEGMEPKPLSLTAEESQYIESRKLNREEVCAVFDMAPPVVHILDRATFSNIVEQFRSMYRDTMAPHLSGFEATLEHSLVPEFDDNLYTEFLMDEVLRGDFETRIPAIAQGIGTGQLTPNEGRIMENRAALPGGDELLVNAALVPTMTAAVNAATAMIRAGFDPSATAAAFGLPTIPHTGLPPVTVQSDPDNEDRPVNKALTAMWGRLGNYQSLADVDLPLLTADLNGHADTVREVFAEAQDADLTIVEFRSRLRDALA